MAAWVVYTMLNAVLLLYCCDHTIVQVECRVTVPLPEVAPVCDGGQLELNCTITGSLLEWRITPEQNLSQLSPQTFVSRRNHDQSVQYGGSTITFTIISHPMHLTSRILISPVYNNLDGIKVECRDAADQQSSSSTFISVVSAQDLNFQQAMIVISSELFNRDDVEVYLEWVTESSLDSYHNVSITPQTSFTIINQNRSSIHLKLWYNVLYNVSIVTVSPCGSGERITIKELYYANCGNPAHRINDHKIVVVDYEEPTMEGSRANFSCRPGYEPIGLHSAECMGNGEWVPDPQELEINCSTTEFTTTNSLDSDKSFVIAIAVAVGGSGCLLLLTVTIVSMAFFAKQKGGSIRRFNRDSFNADSTACIEHDYVHDDQIKVTTSTSGLVYAEVQKQPLPNVSLDLDDTRVEYAQLSHNRVANPPWTESQIEITHKPSNDDSLHVNLDNLLIQLRPQVTPKWYQFGVIVGIRKEVLDYYARKCSPEECMVEMLDYWLRNHKEQLTWREVARAVKAISLQQLASDIETVYKTGKLPVPVEMSSTSNFRDFVGARKAELSPPPLPPKKGIGNENPMQGDVFPIQVERKGISAPPLPPH